MRKLLSIIVCCIFLLTACTSSQSPETEAPEEKYDVTISMLLNYLSLPEDVEMISQRLNELVGEKLQVNFNLIYCATSNVDDVINLCLKKGIDIDIIREDAHSIGRFDYIPLDSLLEKYGKEIIACYPGDVLDRIREDGKIYRLPALADNFISLGLVMQKELLDQYAIDPTQISTLSDVDRLFEFLSKKEPDIKMISPNMSMTMMYKQHSYRSVPNSVCEVTEEGQAMNYFATEEYVNWVKKIYEWNQKGYLPENLWFQNISAGALLKENLVFSYFCTYKPGIVVEQRNLIKRDIEVVQIMKQKITNASSNTGSFGITTQCKHPEEAIQFLDLLFTDSEIVNLLTYGIEGIHYEVLEDGTVGLPEGITAETSGYHPTIGWYFPNQFLSYVSQGDSPDLWDQMEEFISEAEISNTFGFKFDDTPVAAQNKALSEIAAKYQYGLEVGLLDPDVYLPILYQEMEEAGLQEVLSCMQTQYNEWLEKRSESVDVIDR